MQLRSFSRGAVELQTQSTARPGPVRGISVLVQGGGLWSRVGVITYHVSSFVALVVDPVTDPKSVFNPDHHYHHHHYVPPTR